MKKSSPIGIGLKAVVLFAALLGVMVLISKLRPSGSRHGSEVGGNDPISVLFADDRRPFNWCPKDVRRLEVDGKSVETTENSLQIQSYCQILTESFDSSTLDLKSFKPVLKAFGASGKETVIEADSSGKIFRFQGLPFGSKDLSHQLDRKNKR